MADDIPIIDSHIHIYPSSEISSLAWCGAEHPLNQQRSVAEWKAATGSPANLKGFIFLETDRKQDLEAGVKDGSGWEGPLREISWVKRVALGQPKEGEGHTAEDKDLVLAIVPWAPLPSGADAMKKYIELAKEAAGESWRKVKGFRYLLQDKPNGVALEDGFIESLKLLGKLGLVFDLGVDQHNRGRTQLEETVEMIDRAHEGVPEEEKVVFIINHLCKPDLTIYNHTSDPSFIAWRTAMFTLSKCSSTYMKLSGGFPEMTEALKARPADEIFSAISPWLSVVVAAFGPDRIMFASDWPVCTVGVGEDAWAKWKKIVERLCWAASWGDEEKKKIWAETAAKAYRIEI